MKILFFMILSSFALTVVSGVLFVKFSRKKKIGQPIYEYVKTHKDKSGTPTAGGLFFVLPATVVFFAFKGFSDNRAVVAVAVGLAFLIVGFTDDFIKIRSGHNEGLKPYQKIIFQTGIAAIFGVFAFRNGITALNLPFTDYRLETGVFSVFLYGFILVATTNCVNLTDGIDGLAASTSLFYFLAISLVIFKMRGSFDDLSALSFSLIGALSGFLVFNTSKASVFMGDTGSLSLGGFIAAVSVFSNNAVYILLFGIAFVFSGVSVIVQVLYYKATKKRVFLMAPFHHHLQMKGLSEGKIVLLYSLITVLTGAVSLIF